jgi:lysophospholipase L1-like esterase
MTVRNIKKSLAGMEDIAQGVGPVTQTRADTSVVMNRMDVPFAVLTVAEMSALDPLVYTRARVYLNTTQFADYVYDEANLTGVPSDVAAGTWIAVSPRYTFGHRTIESRLQDRLSLKDFGANLDGTDDLTSVQAAINYVDETRAVLGLAGLTTTLSASPVNTFGVPFEEGKVLVPSEIPGYKTQLNTYADDINGLMIARENLATWWLETGGSTLQNMYLFGDSTVETAPHFPDKPEKLVRQALVASGINDIIVHNQGLSGTSWSDLDAIPYLGAATKLIVIKYGINDAVKPDALATLATDARTKLAEIRGNANGGFKTLSILLMGPNSTYRPSTDQDAKWYEDLRNLYVQLCKEFDCAYFDTYAYLQQTKEAPGWWMDDTGTGEGLHPNPVAVRWIWRNAFVDFIFTRGEWSLVKANNYSNMTLTMDAPTPSREPQLYDLGTSLHSALTANGWLMNGILITHRQAGGVVVQTLYSQDIVPRTITRRGGGLTWTQWTGQLLLVTAFLNTWANKLGGHQEAGWQVGADGFIELFGVLTAGVNGSSAFTLPAEARPARAHVHSDGLAGKITVFSDGNVVPQSTDNTTVSLCGIRFPAVAV